MIAAMATIRSRLYSLPLAFSLSSIGDPARAVLQGNVKHFSNLVTWSTIVVAIGVALEGVEIVHDFISWCKRKYREKHERADLKELAKVFPADEPRKAIGSPSEQNPKWVKRVLWLGLITVVAGVVGEWWYGAKLEDAQNAVHEYDVAKLSAAEEEAGKAIARASQIEQDNIRLKIQLAKLQRSSGPRYLSREEQDQLVKALSKYAIPHVIIVSRPEDAEASRFGNDFEAVFTRLGWQPARGWLPTHAVIIDEAGKRIDLPQPGITIWVVTPSNPPAAARALQSALQNLDFPFPSSFDKTLDTGIEDPTKYLKIVIGNR
jgi:hypothetical protein